MLSKNAENYSNNIIFVMFFLFIDFFVRQICFVKAMTCFSSNNNVLRFKPSLSLQIFPSNLSQHLAV